MQQESRLGGGGTAPPLHTSAVIGRDYETLYSGCNSAVGKKNRDRTCSNTTLWGVIC